MRLATIATCCCLAAACDDSTEPGQRVTPDKRAAAADNTGVNVRDRNRKTKTPVDQGNSRTDIRVTADIRKHVVIDEKLSATARNVKIITRNGRVTLRGPVKSADEKARIEQIATIVAGTGRVENQIEVVAQ